jgi:hypothetical protein
MRRSRVGDAVEFGGAAAGALGGAGGDLRGEQPGPVGAGDPLVEELAQGGQEGVLADADCSQVVGAGGGVARVSVVVGAVVVGDGARP